MISLIELEASPLTIIFHSLEKLGSLTDVALIVAVPRLTPLTTPFESIVATLVFKLSQVTLSSLLPKQSAVSVIFSPIFTLKGPVIATPVTLSTTGSGLGVSSPHPVKQVPTSIAPDNKVNAKNFFFIKNLAKINYFVQYNCQDTQTQCHQYHRMLYIGHHNLSHLLKSRQGISLLSYRMDLLHLKP